MNPTTFVPSAEDRGAIRAPTNGAHMTRRAFAIGVALLVISDFASAADYFIKLESTIQASSTMSVQFGALTLGPRPVSKRGGTTFGPTGVPLPESVTVRWQAPGKEPRSETVALKSGSPSSFDSVLFRILENSDLSVFFVVRVGGWRNLEIPLNESAAEAKQRELNEALHVAAGQGQIDLVKDAVAKGANVNYLFGSIYPSPVRYAANGKHREVVDFLLSKGARVKKRDLVAPYLNERVQEMGLSTE